MWVCKEFNTLKFNRIMKIKKIVFFAIIGIVFVSCAGSPNEKALKEINKLETVLFASEEMEINRIKALQLLDSYVAYAEEFPGDTVAAGFLFKAGDIAMNMNQPGRAVSLFMKIMSDYPAYQKLPESMFLIGFIYENQFMDYQKSAKYYKAFIKRFPDNQFAKDAQASIDNLGKTPEQLISEFEAKQNSSN